MEAEQLREREEARRLNGLREKEENREY